MTKYSKEEYDKLKKKSSLSLEEKVSLGIFPSKEEFIEINSQNMTKKEICEFYDFSKSTYEKLRRLFGLSPKKRCVKNIDYKLRREKAMRTMEEKYNLLDEDQRKQYYKQRLEKSRKTCLKKYGVENPTQNFEIQEKMKETFLKNFGVDNPMKSKEVQEKAQKTDLEKYGKPFHIATSEIQEKSLNSILQKYGTRSFMSLPEIEAKRKATNLKKYGVECVLQSEEVREKGYNSLYENGKAIIPSSTQQRHITELVGGILNYPIGPYVVDCFLKEENIGIEYNGGGHNLGVKIGRITPEKFEEKEQRRDNFFLKKDIPIIKLISNNDKIPEDTEIISLIEKAKKKIQNGEKIIVIQLSN